MSVFDTVIVVDWASGKSSGPTPKKDAIWIGVAHANSVESPRYMSSRTAAEAWLHDRLKAERARGNRVLASFDFPFAYPKGFAKALSGSDDPLQLWTWLAQRIEDNEKGENNRFDIAAGINRTFGGNGPFWGNPLKRDIAGLPRKKSGSSLHGLPEKRLCEEQDKGLFTCWQLAGAGAVGAQILMGLPVLHRLRERFGKDLSVWPFEAADAPIVLAEIWPSLLGPVVKEAEKSGEIRDTAQVRLLSKALASLSDTEMKQLLDVPYCEDGAILGAGSVELLQKAANTLVAPALSNDCFALPAGVTWTPVDDALDMLRARLDPIAEPQTSNVKDAVGKVLAEDVIACRANPPLPNTAVDGYGLAYECLEGGGPYELPLVQGRAAAGLRFEGTVPKGHAIRILTGAALPEGVDTVVLQEDVRSDDARIAFNGPIKPKSNTRRAGEDVDAGDIILRAGRKVTPADAALLSAVGVSAVQSYAPLRVGVLSTGDELVETGTKAQAGQIYDANRPMLLAQLAAWGFEAIDLGRAPDDRETLLGMLDDGAAQCDAILTSGGASAGDEDHMSALLAETGSLALWRIALKPGRPLALGMWEGVPIFGLPGNPVAALVCTLIFARPALNLLSGAGWSEPQGFMVPAAFEKRKKQGRREFLRARMREGQVEVFKSEGSGRISGLSWAEGLVELPDGAAEISHGTPVRYIPYAAF
mgnify:FL=1